MSAEEMMDWAEFSKVEPFGDIRADYRSAIVAATVANSQGAKKKVSDFMPFLNANRHQASDVAARFHAEFAKATKHTKVHVITERKARN